jgi:hypothetical protein
MWCEELLWNAGVFQRVRVYSVVSSVLFLCSNVNGVLLFYYKVRNSKRFLARQATTKLNWELCLESETRDFRSFKVKE